MVGRWIMGKRSRKFLRQKNSRTSNQTGGITPPLSELLKDLSILFSEYKDQLTYDEDGRCDTCNDCVWDGFIESINTEIRGKWSGEWFVDQLREVV